ncbi:hypothetical protein ACFQFG_25525 [Methylobacterium persicinum]
MADGEMETCRRFIPTSACSIPKDYGSIRILVQTRPNDLRAGRKVRECLLVGSIFIRERPPKKFDMIRSEVVRLANTEAMIAHCDDALEKRLDIDEFTEEKNELRWKEVQLITTKLYNFYIDEEIFVPYLALEYKNPSRRIFGLRRHQPKIASEDQER